MDALTTMSPTTLPVADVGANPALCLERGRDAVRDVLGELTGDAHRRNHHLAGRDVLPEKDRPLSHGGRWKLVPFGVRHDARVALYEVLVRHRC